MSGHVLPPSETGAPVVQNTLQQMTASEDSEMSPKAVILSLSLAVLSPGGTHSVPAGSLHFSDAPARPAPAVNGLGKRLAEFLAEHSPDTQEVFGNSCKSFLNH